MKISTDAVETGVAPGVAPATPPDAAEAGVAAGPALPGPTDPAGVPTSDCSS